MPRQKKDSYDCELCETTYNNYKTFYQHRYKRITDFKIYYGTDGVTYHKIHELSLTGASLNKVDFKIDNDGKYILDDLQLELYLEDNAAGPADSNKVGNWVGEAGSTVTSDADAAGTDNYAIKCVQSPSVVGIHTLIEPLDAGSVITISCQAKGEFATGWDVFLKDSNNWTVLSSNVEIFAVGTSYGPYSDTFILTARADAIIFVPTSGAIAELFIDQLQIIASDSDAGIILSDTSEAGTEISAEMGYTPSFDLVRDWEQVLVFDGRGHYLNPFIEKEYDNFIMKSAISAGFMYDAVTAGTFLELDKFDGSKTVGMALLPNGNLLILKDQSTMVINPDSNQTSDFGRGNGCIAREGIVTLPNAVMWPGLEDIYMISPSNALEVHGLLDNTIRDIYLADRTLSKAIAIRDKYNTYRLRLYNSDTKKEYLFVDTGWIEEVKYLFVNMYRIGFNHQLWFMNSGNLYIIDKELDDEISVEDLIITKEIPVVLGDGIPSVLYDGNTAGWYYFAENITQVTGVSVWGDKSGNGNDLLQADTTKQPVLDVDGITFDGVDDFLIGAFTNVRPVQIYCVFKNVSYQSGDRVFDGLTASTGAVAQNASSIQMRLYPVGVNALGSVLGTVQVLRVKMHFAGDQPRSWIQLDEGIKGEDSSTSTDMDGLTLGAIGGGGGNWANVQIKEIIIRNILEDSADEIEIYNYLKNKYRL